MSEKIFLNYQKLLKKVDEFSLHAVEKYGDHIFCKYGCIDCCQQNLTLLPLEFYFLREGFARLPEQIKRVIRDHAARDASAHNPCLLLNNRGCLLYRHRPIICRTHGLPLLIREEGIERRDCCPKNFAFYPLESLPATDLLHLERLNTILITVNRAFSSHSGINAGIRLPLTKLPGGYQFA